MLTNIISLFLAISLTGLYSTAEVAEGSIIIQVENCQSSNGQLMVAVFDSEEHFTDNELMGKTQPAVAGEIAEFRFPNLKYGTYAIAVYHDLNENGKLDTRTFGIPTEPYGFSNNPTVKWSAPSFSDASFELASSEQELKIAVKYWKEH